MDSAAVNTETWPPIKRGTIVETTQPNEAINDWTDEVLARQKWGLFGVVIAHHDSHGLCYDVQHEDASVGCYDPSEFKIIYQKPL